MVWAKKLKEVVLGGGGRSEILSQGRGATCDGVTCSGIKYITMELGGGHRLVPSIRAALRGREWQG
jgi:hypothetical protein